MKSNLIQRIALAIWRWLTPQVEGILDPEYKAKLEAIRKRERGVDAAHVALAQKERAFEAELDATNKRHAARQARIEEIDRALAASEAERKRALDELQKTLHDIDARPDVNLIDKPLPGTNRN